MIISKITTQKKSSGRYNIYTYVKDIEEYAFSVDESILVEWQLQKGMELTDCDIEHILRADNERKAWEATIQYITKTMKTEYEIKQYLHKKDYTNEAVLAAVERAKSYGYLDDKEYANAFVRSKIAAVNKGPVVIQKELEEKGVPASYIDQAISQFTLDKQVAAAVAILQKKGKQKKNESNIAFKNRLTQTLIRKGYSHDVVQEAWPRAEIEVSEEEEKVAVASQGEKAFNKWKKKYTSTQLERKVKETLYRKGFSLSLIENYLREREQDENGEKI
ncbi:RecX family transcriptional regulator [Bacillus piscicola]|uniref:RecX family transcriptional regulator n=1 Tax=Bacillus piscicola TaxID=1632684 RepID=UPI001F096EB1|nr:RecX family transcriptional regulator [Bacillus piscicola]